MDTTVIACPHCGLRKEVARGSLPPGATNLRCPRCKQVFRHEDTGTGEAGGAEAPAPAPAVAPPPPPAEPAEAAPAGVDTITCPFCGFSKDLAPGLIKPGSAVTCPKCRQRFVHGDVELDAAVAPPPPPLDEPEPEQPVMPERVEIEAGEEEPAEAASAPAMEETPIAAPAAAEEEVEVQPYRKKRKEKADYSLDHKLEEVLGGGGGEEYESAQVQPSARPNVSGGGAVVWQATGPRVGAPEIRKPGAGPMGVGDLFAAAWREYRARMGKFVQMSLLSVLLFLVGLGIFAGGGLMLSVMSPTLLVLGSIVGTVVGSVAMMWVYAGMVYLALDRSLSVGEALGAARYRLPSFVWLYALMLFLVVGGYLLFVIPGILFALWFIFAQYVVAEDREIGVGALVMSRELGRGRWLGIFGRALLLFLAGALIGMVPFVGPLVNALFFTSFSVVFFSVLYRDLKAGRSDLPRAAEPAQKVRLVVVGSLGYVLLPLVVVSLLFSYANKNNISISESVKAVFAKSGADLSKFGKPGVAQPPALQPSLAPANGAAGTAAVEPQAQVQPPPKGVEGVRLWLDRQYFAPGEAVTVHYFTPPDFPSDALIVAVPSGAPHGGEQAVDQYGLGNQGLEGKTHGDISFTAPAEPGSYDLRMFDTAANGTEAGHVRFWVTGPPAQPEPQGQAPTQ